MALNKYKGFIDGDILPAENVNSIDPDKQSVYSKITGGSNISTLAKFQSLSELIAKVKVLYGDIAQDVAVEMYEFGTPTNFLAQNNTYNFSGGITGESFIAQSSAYINSITLYFQNAGISQVLSLRLGQDINGTVLATASATTISGLTTFTFSAPIKINAGTTYCFTISNTATPVMYWSGTFANCAGYSGSWSASTHLYFTITQVAKTGLSSYDKVASNLQTAIRTATLDSSTVIYNTDHFEVLAGTSRKELYLTTPNDGIDISGNTDDGTGKKYLNLGDTATHTNDFGTAGYLLSGNSMSDESVFTALGATSGNTKLNNYGTGNVIYGNNKVCLTIKACDTGYLDKIKISFLKRYITNAGIINFKLYLADANKKPTGSIIKTISTTADKFVITVDNTISLPVDVLFGLQLTANTYYSIVCEYPNGNSNDYLQQVTAQTYVAGLNVAYSNDGGSNWTVQNITASVDTYFRELSMFKANIDGTVFDNISVNVSKAVSNLETVINQTGASSNWSTTTTSWVAQHMLFDFVGKLYNFTLNASQGYPGAISVKLFRATQDGIPTGSFIQEWTFSYGTANPFGTLTTPLDVTIGDRLVFVIKSLSDSAVGTIYGSNAGLYTGGNMMTSSNSGVDWVQQTTSDLYLVVNAKKNINYWNSLASAIQEGIRAVTGKLETVLFLNGRFKIKSSLNASTSKVLKLMTPSTGTDISGAGATAYLDCANNATEVFGSGDDYNLVRLNKNGYIPEALLPPVTSYAGVIQITSGVTYQAQANGVVTCVSAGGTNQSDSMSGYTDAVDATTLVARYNNTTNYFGSISFPVIKGHYYKIISSGGAGYNAKFTTF